MTFTLAHARTLAANLARGMQRAYRVQEVEPGNVYEVDQCVNGPHDHVIKVLAIFDKTGREWSGE